MKIISNAFNVVLKEVLENISVVVVFKNMSKILFYYMIEVSTYISISISLAIFVFKSQMFRPLYLTSYYKQPV